MAESAVAEMTFADEIKTLGDRLVGLTVLQAKELKDYLQKVHGLEAAVGGAVMVEKGKNGVPPVVEEKTEFDVVLEAFGAKKIEVIKIVRAATGLGLKEAKDLVEGAPKPIKQGISKQDAEKLKKELEEAGATVSLK